MAHYQYEGQHYQLPDGLSNEEAINKIKTHLGKGVKKTPEGADYWDKAPAPISALAGAAEAGAGLVSGAASALVAAPVGLASDIGARLQGKTIQEAQRVGDESLNALMEAGTYRPRTKRGDTYTDALMEPVNQLLIPSMGVHIPTAPRGINRALKRAMPEAFPGEGSIPKPTIDARLAEIEARKKPTVPVEDVAKPLEYTPESPLAIDNTRPYQYEGAINAPELLDRSNLRKTFDPMAEAKAADEAAQRAQAQEQLSVLKQQFPEDVAALMKEDPAAKMETQLRLDEQAARDTRMKEQQMALEWDKRNETLGERASARIAKEDWIDRLDTLEENLLGERVSKGQRRQARGRQRGVIDPDLLTFGFRAILDQAIALGHDQPVRRALGKFVGTYHADRLKEAYNNSLDPRSNERIIMMKPDTFHNLATHRKPYELNGPHSAVKRAGVTVALKGKQGLSDIPYLIVGKDGQVIGHEGRHRMDVFNEQGLKEVPVLVKTPYYKNGDGPFPFDRLKPQDEAAFSSGINKPLINEANRAAHDYTETASTRGGTTVRGMSSRPGMGGQRGAIDFSGLGPEISAKLKRLEELSKEKLFTPKPQPEAVIEEALSEGKDGRGINSLASGATLEAAKRNSALIQGVARIIQHEVNKADLDIRTIVFPAEKALRSLSKQELTPLMKVFLSETKEKYKYTMEELSELGLSPKQLAAYNEVRQMFTETLAKENEARALQGKKPVTEAEYYSASRWVGDFRQDFHDAAGKHVWSLAGVSKRQLAQQRDALLQNFPDLIGQKERVVRAGKGDVNPVEMYKTLLEILGDDPAIEKIKDWYEGESAKEIANTLAQEKHFKNKAGIQGFVGTRPSNTLGGKFDATKEALAFFQQQINYSKNGLKWASMQHAGADIKSILSNEDLIKQQPNNVAYARDYLKQNLGFGEAKAIAGLEDSLRNLGISPTEIRGGLGNVKAAWTLQKLVASPGFILSNFVQAANIMPHLADIQVKYGGNPATALAGGMLGVLHLGFGHLFKTFGADPSGKFNTARALATPDFMNKALKYAEDNGVTSRSTYDESPIQSTFNPVARGVDLAAKTTITAPETLLRAFTFSTIATQLKSSKARLSDLEIFRLAEERTNMAMGDYRSGERPMVFSKLGGVGELMGTLQTFPMNFYNQWNWAVRESLRGNVVPAVTMFAMQSYLAGAMGLPGFQDADKLWEMLKEWSSEHSPKLWNNIKDYGPKQMVMDHLGEDALYGNASTETGLAMTSRIAAPSFTDMAQMPGGMAMDIGKQVGNVAGAVANPSAENVANAVIGSAPVGLQGALETGPFRDVQSRPREDGQLYLKRGTPTPEGDVVRTPGDETARRWGMRTQREVLTKDETYRASARRVQGQAAATAAMDKFYNAARKNDVETAQSYAKLYTELSGKGITNEQISARLMREFTSGKEKTLTAAKTLEAMRAAKRMMEIIEASKTTEVE